MPGSHGGDQLGEDYAPHLYYDGKLVGEDKAKELRDKEEKIQRKDISSLLEKSGVKNFDNFKTSRDILSKKDYTFKKYNSDWQIIKEPYSLGFLRQDYIEINYDIDSNNLNQINLNQIGLAKDLFSELKIYGVKKIVENPPREIVMHSLNSVLKDYRKIIKKLKN